MGAARGLGYGPGAAAASGASGAVGGALFGALYSIPGGPLLGLGTLALLNVLQGGMTPREATATAAAQSFLCRALAGPRTGLFGRLRARLRAGKLAPEYRAADPARLRSSPAARAEALYHRVWKHTLPPPEALATLNAARARHGLPAMARVSNRRIANAGGPPARRPPTALAAPMPDPGTELTPTAARAAAGTRTGSVRARSPPPHDAASSPPPCARPRPPTAGRPGAPPRPPAPMPASPKTSRA